MIGKCNTCFTYRFVYYSDTCHSSPPTASTSLESTQRHIRPLGGALAARPNRTVFRAGIAGCIPAETRFDYLRMQSDLVPSAMWSDAAVRQIEEMFAGAEIQFTIQMVVEEQPNDATATLAHGDGPDHRHTEDHYFGDVQVLTHAGRRVNAAVVLAKMAQAQPLERSAFVDWILTAQTRSVNRWHDNRRQAVQPRNELRLVPGGRQKPTAVTPYVEQKIDDWIQRNRAGQPHDNEYSDDDNDSDDDDDYDGDSNRMHSGASIKVRQPARPPKDAVFEPCKPAARPPKDAVVEPRQPEAVARPSTPLTNRLQRMQLDLPVPEQRCTAEPVDTGCRGGLSGLQLPPTAPASLLGKAMPDDHPLMRRIQMRDRVVRSLQEREHAEKAAAEQVKAAAEQVKAAAERQKAAAEREKANRPIAVAPIPLQKILSQRVEHAAKPLAHTKVQQPSAGASATAERTPFEAPVPIGYALSDLHTFNRPSAADVALPPIRQTVRAPAAPIRIAVPSGGRPPTTTTGGAEQW